MAWHEQGPSGNYFICLRIGERRFRRSLKTNSRQDADGDLARVEDNLRQVERGCHRRRAERKDHVWAWDFVFDRTTAGSQLKWLSIVDEYTRECLTLKCDRSITSEDVIDTLAELFAMRGVPEHIRSDNGPEFVAVNGS